MRYLYTGTTEFLTVTVTSNLTLDAQPVYISFDRTEWLTASWTGAAGTTRSARVLLDSTNLPPPGKHPVYVKVTDSPEIPVVRADDITVK